MFDIVDGDMNALTGDDQKLVRIVDGRIQVDLRFFRETRDFHIRAHDGKDAVPAYKSIQLKNVAVCVLSTNPAQVISFEA